jgi:AcrR family transcriptional regulator
MKTTSNLPTARGRPRDEGAQSAILNAALDIVREQGPAALTLDAIAKYSGTSRPTLYRWWPSKGTILLDAVLEATNRAVTYKQSGVFLNDLRQHARDYVALLTGPYGAAYRAVFAEGLANNEFMQQVRTRLIGPRRAMTHKRLIQAVEAGELRGDTDLEGLIDALYGPILYRLILQHQPLTFKYTDAHINHVLKGIA